MRYINIIINSGISSVLVQLIEALDIVNRNINIKINLLLTRWWRRDLEESTNLHLLLKKKNIDSEIKLSHDVFYLENIISQGDLTLSQNLHGMIMSIRKGVLTIPLDFNEPNSPNSIKIQSFARQINVEEYMIQGRVCPDVVGDAIVYFLENKEELLPKLRKTVDVLASERKKWLRGALTG